MTELAFLIVLGTIGVVLLLARMIMEWYFRSVETDEWDD